MMQYVLPAVSPRPQHTPLKKLFFRSPRMPDLPSRGTVSFNYTSQYFITSIHAIYGCLISPVGALSPSTTQVNSTQLHLSMVILLVRHILIVPHPEDDNSIIVLPHPNSMTVSNGTPSVLILDSDFWSPLSLCRFTNNELRNQAAAPALMAAVGM